MNPTSNTLILGMLSRMSLEQARPIFLSLEKTGYQGDICVFVRDVDKPTLDFLRQRRVNLVPFQMAYLKPAWSWFVNLASPFLQPAQKARLTEEFGLTYLHLQCSRFIYWQSFLREFGQLYQYVMLCDMRDVLFQRPPFDFEIPEGVSMFMEEKNIGACPFTSQWIERGFGKAMVRKLADKPIACCGTTIGTTQPSRITCR